MNLFISHPDLITSLATVLQLPSAAASSDGGASTTVVALARVGICGSMIQLQMIQSKTDEASLTYPFIIILNPPSLRWPAELFYIYVSNAGLSTQQPNTSETLAPRVPTPTVREISAPNSFFLPLYSV